MNAGSTLKPLVVSIMGPTASGKTASALAVAARIPSEIISVDSALVFRGMDIGSAKPSKEELAAVPHHLIDILDPKDAYSAMQFRSDTLQLITEIQTRGNLPLLVGGTMLYFKALRDGLDELPNAEPEVRERLDREAEQIGWPGMHAKLAKLDPVTAERLKPNDSQRIQRALEIIELSGQPMSELLTGRTPQELPFDILPLALEPSDRSVLHARIAQRFDLMLNHGNQGFRHEVEALRARGDLHLGLPSMRCVGYRQMWEHLDGLYDHAEMRERAIAATRQLAKRQLTWLRSMPERQILDCLSPHTPDAVLTSIDAELKKRRPPT